LVYFALQAKSGLRRRIVMEYDLIFEGGGAKGLAFVGALRGFEIGIAILVFIRSASGCGPGALIISEQFL
jgi:predicted acylesterase/phospholipase RssA